MLSRQHRAAFLFCAKGGNMDDPLQRVVDWQMRSLTGVVLDLLQAGIVPTEKNVSATSGNVENLLVHALDEKYCLDAIDKEIMWMYRTGYTQIEIGEKLKKTDRTIRNRFKKIGDYLSR